MADSFSSPVDVTMALEAIFAPLVRDGLICYDFSDAIWIWGGDCSDSVGVGADGFHESQQIFHQRLEGDDLAVLELKLSDLFAVRAANRVLCNIGHSTLAVSVAQYEKIMGTVARHFNAPVRGTVWRRMSPGYVIDVVVLVSPAY